MNFTHFCSKTNHINGSITLYISKNTIMCQERIQCQERYNAQVKQYNNQWDSLLCARKEYVIIALKKYCIIRWSLDSVFELALHVCVFFLWIPCTVYGTRKYFFPVKTTLKLDPTVLFTHLKIILLYYFQFSTRNDIQTNPQLKIVSPTNLLWHNFKGLTKVKLFGFI